MSVEQLGMRSGLLIAAIFPLIGTVLTIIMKIYFAKINSKQNKKA
jgi:hypothetical protein